MKIARSYFSVMLVFLLAANGISLRHVATGAEPGFEAGLTNIAPLVKYCQSLSSLPVTIARAMLGGEAPIARHSAPMPQKSHSPVNSSTETSSVGNSSYQKHIRDGINPVPGPAESERGDMPGQCGISVNGSMVSRQEEKIWLLLAAALLFAAKHRPGSDPDAVDTRYLSSPACGHADRVFHFSGADKP